jgi:hypothetical protein
MRAKYILFILVKYSWARFSARDRKITSERSNSATPFVAALYKEVVLLPAGDDMYADFYFTVATKNG